MGATGDVEKLDTRVTLSGVETVQRGQELVGAGFRAMRGDIKGAAGMLKEFKLGTSELMIAGGIVAGAGAGMLKVMRDAVNAAAMQEEAQVRLAAAFRATGMGSGAAAGEIAKLAAEIQNTTTAGDEELINAAAMLASYKVSASQMKEYLPRLVDIQDGVQKLGKEEMSLEQIAATLGKGHMGQIGILRRMGVMVDAAAYKSKGYKAILEEVDAEYKGRGAAAAASYSGSLKQLNNAVGDMYESLGLGLLGPLKSVNTVLRPGVNLLTRFNEATHGAAGALLAVGGAAAVLSGGVLFLLPGIKALRDMWREVTGAAAAATIAQQAAVASAAGAGAAAAQAAGGAAAQAAGGAAAAAAGGAAAAATSKAAGRGILGQLSKALPKFSRGLGAGLGLGVAGELVGGFGAARREKFIESRGRTGGMGAAAGAIGGGVLKGAGLGAAVGSVIPGLGTAIGGAIGAATGALYSFVRTATDKELAKARREGRTTGGAAAGGRDVGKTEPRISGGQLAVPRDPLAASSNGYLRAIADEVKSQTRAIVGGGKRTAQSYNQADIQRAVYGMLGKAVS